MLSRYIKKKTLAITRMLMNEKYTAEKKNELMYKYSRTP